MPSSESAVAPSGEQGAPGWTPSLVASGLVGGGGAATSGPVFGAGSGSAGAAVLGIGAVVGVARVLAAVGAGPVVLGAVVSGTVVVVAAPVAVS